MRPIWPTGVVRGGGDRHLAYKVDVVACRRAYIAGAGAVPHAADPLHAVLRRVEIEWAPFIASTSAGPKGRPPPTGPPSRRAVRSPSVTHRSWLAADDWPRPGRPAPGSSGWPGLRPADPATAEARAAVISLSSRDAAARPCRAPDAAPFALAPGRLRSPTAVVPAASSGSPYMVPAAAAP